MIVYIRLMCCWMMVLCFPLLTWAQTNLTFEILDAQTGRPISNAFLFIQNSTIGASTDEKGFANIEVKNLEDYVVVITHINYVNATIPSNELSSTTHKILLTPNPVDLQEIVVQTKKRNASKRKRWMRQFQSEIFGPDIKKSQIKLLNPEAIWFEEKEGTLVAHAIDNLKINNQYMGYHLQLVLDHFSVSNQGDVKYNGKIFFEDLKAQQKNPKPIEERRAQYYSESKQLFFLSLVHGLPINTQQFELGITIPKEDGTFSYSQKGLDSLNWRPGVYADTILTKDYLTVIQKKVPLHKVNRLQVSKPNTSFLRSTTGQFILDHNGSIINQIDIEESGYWSNHRLAVELPIDYEGGVKLRTSFRILDSLAALVYHHPPEKVFLHTNKTFFSNREQLWFKGYLVNGISNRPITPSKVLYVDLISPAKQIIQTWELHRSTGLSGDFHFTRNHEPGTYYLRGYTNFMRNAGNAFFFERPLTVIDVLENDELAPGLTKINAGSIEPVVSFFPEGGDLVAGISANVAFLITDQNGAPIETHGYISNQNGEKLLHAKTYHKGTGLFSFIPQQGQSYSFNFTFNQHPYSTPLPKVFPDGLTLQVNATEEEALFIKVAATDSLLLQDAFLVGHARGVPFLEKRPLKPGESLKITKNQIPKGLLHFTLFDSRQRPQAERLVFNEYSFEETLISLSKPTPSADAEKTQVLQLACDSSILHLSKDVSVSIVNMDLTPDIAPSADIKSYFLLNSDLYHAIPNASDYLNETDAIKRFYLDLLLLCQTWRRFTWRSLIDGDALPTKFKPETGYAIAGYTTPKGDSTPVQTEVMLNTLDESIVYKKIRTDESGNFRFSQLPAFDSTTYFLQARINKDPGRSENGKVEGNRLVDFHLHPRSPAPFNAPHRAMFQDPMVPELSTTQRTRYQEKSLTDDQYGTADWTIDLEGVEVTAKRSYRSNRPTKGKFYNLDAMDWIAPESRGTGLLAQLAPRFNFAPGPEGKLITTFPNDLGQQTTAPMQIIINGMGANPEGSNAARFLGLPADMIQTIYIDGGAIIITTRSIPRTRAAYLESGILQYDHPGYYQARAFKLPAYPQHLDYDLRSTVLWDPNFTFDKNGKAILKFDSNHFLSRYQINVVGTTESGKLISETYTIP